MTACTLLSAHFGQTVPFSSMGLALLMWLSLQTYLSGVGGGFFPSSLNRTHTDVASIIAMIPALMALDSAGHASAIRARSGSVLQVSVGKWWARGGLASVESLFFWPLLVTSSRLWNWIKLVVSRAPRTSGWEAPA